MEQVKDNILLNEDTEQGVDAKSNSETKNLFIGKYKDENGADITIKNTDNGVKAFYNNGRGPFDVVSATPLVIVINFSDDGGNKKGTLSSDTLKIDWENNTKWTFLENLTSFKTSGEVQDFLPADPGKQRELNVLWSQYLDGFTQQGILGNPWNEVNIPKTTTYYNAAAPIPSGKKTQANVRWRAFPGRLLHFFGAEDQKSKLFEIADTGKVPDVAPKTGAKPTPEQIPENPCKPGTLVDYYPYGPRGWQDEYCEWAVTRNTAGKITRIDFTCDNPEYFNVVWAIDPNKVLELYQETLGSTKNIKLEDLELTYEDAKGNVTTPKNPITGNAYYNPLNKWNNGTVSDANSGGAMHLTSTPNTIQTEIAIASAATVLRTYPAPDPNTTRGQSGEMTNWGNSNDLLCDAQYGQKYRNSDPSIGMGINQAVGNYGGNSYTITISQPLGLYMQMPVFPNFKLPKGKTGNISDFWTIKRGSKTLNGEDGQPILIPGTSNPANFILHAVFEVPEDKGFVVEEIQIPNPYNDNKYEPIDYGSKIAHLFKMQIIVDAIQLDTKALSYGYAETLSGAGATDQPVQLFYENYYHAMSKTKEANPGGYFISLLSNSTFVPVHVKVEGGAYSLILTCVLTATSTDDLTITFTDANGNEDLNIVVVTTNNLKTINYAVPGNTLPASYHILSLSVTVNAGATLGAHNLIMKRTGQEIPVAMPALLYVESN